jgi:membrane associated rhomboid family serine protease
MAKRWQQSLTFGGRLPWAVGLLLSATVILSLSVAFGDRHAGAIFEFVSLVPANVWRGEIWRLVTWPFVEPTPLGLIFGCLFLYWFGNDLAREWGSRRFLGVFSGVMLVAALGTCLIARVDPPVLMHPYLGSWALTTAMVVAWGLWFRDRVVRIYFVLPVRGYWLAWGTVAFTVVYAIYTGWMGLLPELFAEASILAWLFRKTILSRWTKTSRSFDSRRREADRMKGARKRGRVAVDYLRAVEPPDSKDGDSN